MGQDVRGVAIALTGVLAWAVTRRPREGCAPARAACGDSFGRCTIVRMSHYAPTAPFADWPCHVCFSGGFAWLAPAGVTDVAIVTQTCVEEATATTAHAVSDFLDDLLRRDALANAAQVWVLHDWRSLQRVRDGARSAWTARTRRAGNPFGQAEIYVALGGSSMLRMALRTAALTIQLTQGQRAARFVDDVTPVLQQARVRAPSRTGISAQSKAQK